MITGLLNILAQTVRRPTNCGDGSNDAFNPGSTPGCVTNLPTVASNSPSDLKLFLGVVFGVAAGIALISLTIAALNFATAFTDSEKIARSKKAILFSLLGLVIALSAEFIILVLLDNL